MATHQPLRIGMFGFGVVGEGLYKALQQTPSLQAVIHKICIKNPDKKRGAPAGIFTTDRNLLLEDPDINVIVEVISDSEAAFSIVSKALRNGKAVVSASKKMIAENLVELLALQRETGLPFLYEAAAGASIPIIRNLEEYYDNDLLHSIKGIINGSTNYILTRIFEEKLAFREALILAQQLGFAESDPVLDVEGHDAAHKWSFLLTHAYGITDVRKMVYTGIQAISNQDAVYAQEKNYVLRLVAMAKKMEGGRVAAFVLPQFVPADDQLSFVRNEYNGIVIESGFADKQFFYGKGAGSFPTASAILSDLSALRYQYHYEYKKLYHQQPLALTNDFYIRVYLRYTNWNQVPGGTFIATEEWHSGENRKFVTGVIPFRCLHSDWWKAEGLSLVALPDPFVDRARLQSMQKNNLAMDSTF